MINVLRIFNKRIRHRNIYLNVMNTETWNIMQIFNS